MAAPSPTRVAIIGGGAMGGALACGLAGNGWTGVRVVEALPGRRAELAEMGGFAVTGELAEAVDGAEVVCLLVKPKDVGTALAQLSRLLAEGTLVSSMCAGVSLATLAAGLPTGTPIVRVMPNTPAQVGKGMSVLSPGETVSTDQLELAVSVLGAVGRTMVLPESLQDAATAVSGSGPAYVCYLAEAMIEAGVQLGLTRGQATELVVGTIEGSGALLAGGQHPTLLRESVTSPGGTTAAAIRQLDAHGVRGAVSDALWAAHDRSRG